MEQVPIHLLNAFMVFNESQNITKAAKVLGITQPALSKQLKALEEKISHPLFSIQGRKKVLTAFGRDLHHRIKSQIGNLQDTVQESVILFSNSNHVQVRISGRRGILDRLSEKLKFPGTLIFNESSNQQVIDDLLSLRTEIGIVYDFPNTYNFIAKPLFKEEFILAIPKKFLPQKKKFGKSILEDLKSHPCIGFNVDDNILNHLCATFSIPKSQLQLSRITSDYSCIAKMVDGGFGWAVLPSYLPINESKSWIIPIPSEDLDLRNFSLLYRQDFSKVPWFLELIKEIKEIF